ncbi:head maturation protease, ClpP-related [Actinoplanes sp. NPDC049668]|uniref:head maturation protease, ClpP-related n=1 Tax=unclassified Actinoplanes TaxID=2626549 RepID=UPI0033B0CFC9
MIPQPSNLAALRAAWRAAEGVTAAAAPCFRLVNAATPKLYVSGMIGGFDLDAQDFVLQVHALNAKAIDLHVNSAGGFVWDTLSMYEALKSHPATVTAHVDGLAASAASFLIQAADHRVMATGSRGMVHDAQLVAVGSPAEVRQMADIGDAVSDDIASIYAERAGGKPAAWRKAMTATTWYSAQQMVDANLADRVATKQSGPDNRSRLITARVRALATREG